MRQLHGRRSALAGEDGFTLVELLVVVVILGILSAVVVFAVRGASDKGEGAAVATDERVIRTAEELHCAQFGRYTNGQGLADANLLSAPPEIHNVETADASDPLRQGNCGTDPVAKHYKITCVEQDCGIPTIDPPAPPAACLVDKWCPVTSPVPDTNGGPMVQLADGRVLLFGGRPGSTGSGSVPRFNAIYDPAGPGQGTWSTTTPTPLQQSGFSTAAESPVLLSEPNCGSSCGQVLVSLFFGAPDESATTSYWWLFNPANGTWKSAGLAGITAQSGYKSAVRLSDGRVLLLNPESGAELYNPATSSFTPIANGVFTSGAGRTSGLMRLNDGRILLSGHTESTGIFFNPDPLVKLFNPQSNTFSDAALPKTYYLDNLVLLSDGRILAMSEFGKNAEIYRSDSGGGSWSDASSCATELLPSPAGFPDFCQFLGKLPNGKVIAYVNNEQDGSDGRTWLFDPSNPTAPWIPTTGVLNDRTAAGRGLFVSGSCATNCNKLLAVGTGGKSELYTP